MDDMDDKFSGGSKSADPDELPKPMWVPATINYNGQTWTQVGMRYKGHSSLKAAWQSGVRKLSFILNFDYYEEQYPELANQRFYGFNRVSFSNAYNDPSLIREKVGASIFRAGGVPAAQSAFYAVYVDWGAGAKYFGLYTIVEDPCDAMLATQLGDGSGQCYKPWGEAARWLSTQKIGAEDLAAHFESCSGETNPDMTNIMGAINALHADRSDAAAWRANLEAKFDVQSFIKTMAINQVMMNWDSYGCMHHNYYVYENPLNGGRIFWFPWDLNESMLYRTQAGCPAPGSVLLTEILNPQSNSSSTEIDTDWPLIQYILGDAVYFESYKKELQAALDGAFNQTEVINKLQRYHELVAPYVVGPTETEAYPYTNTTKDGFNNSLTTGTNALIPHVKARRAGTVSSL